MTNLKLIGHINKCDTISGMLNFLKPIFAPVKRQGAERNLLLILISFAVSVIFTRFYLSLANYPQIGGGVLHIAHVLWGGLLLFAASILPLIFTNRRIYPISAILAGTGVGLFIDEVGKFITEANDYFFQPAATIIYALFLIVVLIYMQIKKPRSHDARTELYHALDALEEVLDSDLEQEEYDDLLVRLKKISKEKSYPELSKLAESILTFLTSENIRIAERNETLPQKLLRWMQTFEEKFIKRRVFKSVLTVILAIVGIGSIGNIVLLVRIAVSNEYLQRILAELLDAKVITGDTELILFGIRFILETIAGFLLLAATYFMIRGKEKRGVSFGYYGLLFSLTTINLLAFYFDQFRAVVGSLFELGLLLALIRYKMIFLTPSFRRTARK